MNRRMLSVGVALVLTLTLAGAAAAAVPMAGEAAAHGFGKAMGGIVVRVANFLGIEVSQVQEARAEGNTLADILGEKTEAFVAASVAERKVFIAQLLESGKITPEQAALCEAQVGDKITERLTSDTFGRGAGNFAQEHAMKRMVQKRQNRQTLINKGL